MTSPISAPTFAADAVPHDVGFRDVDMMTGPPRVTVAIPVYNSAGTLERALRSVMAQSLREVEILVADDGSSDDSGGLAERLAREDGRIRVIRMERNGGKPAAMNRMVREARAPWVAVLDADDAFDPWRLERLLAEGEARGVEMVADNVFYRDAGVDEVLRTGFDPSLGTRVLGKADIVASASSLADFDLGILKPMVKREFMLANELFYFEQARLAEDFYYLLNFMVAGGRLCVLGEAHYIWTLPFGTVSRQWTGTGSGAWRYDYRRALVTNAHFIEAMQRRGETEVVGMLRRREQEYGVMVHYLDAQRLASERRLVACVATILRHPATWRLLAARLTGRLRRMVGGEAGGVSVAGRRGAAAEGAR